MQLAYDTGMRQGEVLGLKWENVDLREGVPTLRPTDTKTQEEREIPLDENLQIFSGEYPKFWEISMFSISGIGE